MNTSAIGDVKYQELKLEINCERQEDKIVILARIENATYRGEKALDPDIDFDDLKDALNSKHFKILSKTPELLKLKVGFLNIELHNQ